MQRVSVFTKIDHYRRKFRGELMPMLRPFIKDRERYTDEDRARDYGTWVSKVEITEEALGADLAVLPMSWNYYRVHKRERLAVEFVSEARRAGLQVLSWTSGDFGVTPLDRDVYVLRSSGYRSKRLPRQFALPVFVKDPLVTYFNQSEPILYPKTDVPVVGFCGLAHAPLYKIAYDIARTAVRNVRFHTGLSPFEPQELYPATWRRARALSLIRNNSMISDNFVVRTAYRAGARMPEDIRRTKIEYFRNIKESGYIICVRGNGNFSARLYETMAMGRIPVIIDTDCIYPYDELIDWKGLCVWVDARRMDALPKKLLKFHASLDDNTFVELQRKIRREWVERLSMGGYFATLFENVNQGLPLRL